MLWLPQRQRGIHVSSPGNPPNVHSGSDAVKIMQFASRAHAALINPNFIAKPRQRATRT